MRLDLFLKMSRLIKRRSIAKIACDGKKVSVNGKIEKPSYEVKIGDIIKIEISNPPVEVRVVDSTKKIGKQAAKEMFEKI